MLRRSCVLRIASRKKIAGPGSRFDVTQFGRLDPPKGYAEKRGEIRLLRQPHLIDEAREASERSGTSTVGVRTRTYAICMKCGSTMVTVGFDKTPSARLGLFMGCGKNDYTHHKLRAITESQYWSLVELKDTEERLRRVRFDE